MSHAAVARVWALLVGREDVENISLELIGTHLLNVATARRDKTRLRTAYVHHIASIRTIFDLQRLYLQCSAYNTGLLLALDRLYSAVLHLMDTIAVAVASCPSLCEDTAFNRLTAQTVLSAIRLLLLRKQTLSATEYDQLNSKLEEIYERGHWQGHAFTTVLRVCRQAMLAAANSESAEAVREPMCSRALLPDIFGEDSFEVIHKAIMHASAAIKPVSTNSSTWLADMLVLYDLSSCVLAALVHLHLRRGVDGMKDSFSPDIRSPSELVNEAFTQDAQHLMHRLTRCDETAIDQDRAAERLRLVLVQDMFYMGDNSERPSGQLSPGTRSPNRQGRRSDSLDNTLDLEVQNALLQFTISLRNRAILLHNIYGKKTNLPGTDGDTIGYQQSGDKMTPQPEASPPAPRHIPSIAQMPDARPSPLRSMSFPEFVGRPQHHDIDPTPSSATVATNGTLVINESFQRQRSDRSIDTCSTEALTATTEVFSDRSAPLSSIGEDDPVPPSRTDSTNGKESVVTEKRMPLTTTESLPEVWHPGTPTVMDACIRAEHERSQSWAPDLDNHPELVLPQIPRFGIGNSAASILSEDSGSLARPPTISVKSKKWHKGLFGNSSTANTASPPVASFSASGTTLLVWNDFGAGCYSTNDIDCMTFTRISTSPIHMAAGGVKRCVLAAKDAQQAYRLEVFEPPSTAPVRSFPLHSPPHALALSQNDALIAAKYSRCVDIYHISSGSHVRHPLPSPRSRATPGNHQITFSTDSMSFAASTRYEPEKVITYWSPCFDPSKGLSIETSNPTGFPGDNGLSSLLCSSPPTPTTPPCAFLSSFTEKGVPLHLTFKSPTSSSTTTRARPLRDPKGRIGTRIHHAALSPSGNSIAFLNQRNDVFWVDDCWTTSSNSVTSEPRRVATVKRNVGVVREVVMGMPSNDEVNLFWMEKGGLGAGVLGTVGRGGGKGKPVVVDVRRDLGCG